MTTKRPAAVGLALSLACASTPADEGATFEQPPMLRASQALPAALLAGPNHRVGERVVNDGYMNHYAISSRFGDLEAQSTAELAIRVHELDAVAEMEKVNTARGFQAGVERSADSLIGGVGALLADPVAGVQNTASGVNKLFGRIQSAGDEDQDDLLGFDKAKREIAAAYGVDPYSSNPMLQAELDRLANANATGGLALTGALAPVGGAAGIAISATTATTKLNEMVKDNSVAELEAINARELAAMGVGQDVIDLFIGAPELSPRHQTAIVGVLRALDEAADRALVVKQAVHTTSEDQALFRVRQLAMYLRYDERSARVRRFIPAGKYVVGAVDSNGDLVVAMPIDLMAWTREVAAVAGSARESLEPAVEARSRRLVVTGTLTPLARRSMEALGWTVDERFSLEDG